MTDYLPARRVPARAGAAHRRAAGPDGRRRRRRRDVPGDIETALGRPRGGGREGRARRRDPGGARRRPLHRLPGRQGRGQRARPRPGLDDPLRRARRHRRHRVRLAVGPRPADAPAHRVGRAARRPLPPDRAARLLARARDPRLDGRGEDAVLRDDRDRAPRPRRVPHRGVRDRDRRVRRASSSPSTSTSATPATRRAPARRSPAASRRASCSTPYAGSASSCPVVGVDVVEVSPPYDHADITAALANRVVLEALSAIARRRRDERDGTTWDPSRPLLDR